MKRSIVGVAFLFSFVVTSVAHADTTVPLQDPLTDVMQLWSGIASEVQSVAQEVALTFEGKGVATSGEPASSAAAVNAFKVPQAPSSPSAPQQPAAATTTVINYITNPIERVVDEEPSAPMSFVTQSELAASLLSLSNSLAAQFTPTTTPAFPQYIAANGNSDVPYAAANSIGQLSNVTISNPTISGGSIPASSITGDITTAINTATGEIDSLTGTGLTYVAATTTNATSTNLYASNLSAGTLIASGTTTLSLLDLANLNCATYGNGGKLTTDANGTVVCAADQGGSGSTVGGSDTQVQFNSGGSFAGSSAFTFASSTNLLAVTNASTTDLSAGGEGYFATASTTNLVVSNSPSGFLQTNAQGVVSATSTLSATSLFGTLGTINGTALPAGDSITVTAASSTLLADSSTFSGSDDFTNALSSFAGSWQGLSPNHFQTAGTYLTGLGNYATTTAAAISISTTTLSWNGLTLGSSFVVSPSGITVTPTVSGTINKSALTDSTIRVNGTTLTLGDTNDTITAASSTLLSNANAWTGLQQFGNASTTLGTISALWLPNVSANSLAYLNGSNQVAAASVSYPVQFSGGALSLAFGTTTANAWSQLQTLQSGFLSQASSTVVGTLTLTGSLSAQGAAFTGSSGTTTIASGQGFTVGGSQFVVQQGSGNVGIGTTMPDSPDGFTGVLELSNSTNASYVVNSGTHYGEFAVSSNGGWVSTGSNDPLRFATNNIERMRIDTSGNVGIGTTNPLSILDVKKGSNEHFNISTPDSGSTGIKLYSLNDAGTTDEPVEIVGSNIWLMGGTGSGNVGIGTTSPTSVLSISTAIANAASPYAASDKYVVMTNSSGNSGTLVTANNGNTWLNADGGHQLWLNWYSLNNPSSKTSLLIGNGDGAEIAEIDALGNMILNGCVEYNGGTSGTCLSDERLKTNVNDFTDGLSEIVGLNPVTYQYNGLAGTPNDVATGEVRTGLIAQQVQQAAPDFVATTTGQLNGATTTLYEVNYNDLTFALINAVKEIATISSTFEQNLIAWLGDASNGIIDLFAENGHFSNELCVGSTCVTPAQFQAMVAAAGQTASPQQDNSTTTTDSEATDTPPVIQVNGDNPAIIQVGATYSDLGATITGPQADLNLGIQTFVNGSLMSPVVIDTSVAATDTIDYVVTDQNGLTSTSTRTVIVEVPSIVPSDDASTTAETATTTDATTTSQ